MPKQSFNIGGWRPLGVYRVKENIFGTTLEEQVEKIDGIKYWRKADLHTVLLKLNTLNQGN